MELELKARYTLYMSLVRDSFESTHEEWEGSLHTVRMVIVNISSS
jgi:hypothetical protein